MRNRRKVVKIEINLLFDNSRESIKNAPLRKIYDQAYFSSQIFGVFKSVVNNLNGGIVNKTKYETVMDFKSCELLKRS